MEKNKFDRRKNVTARTLNLAGSSYEIGRQMARITASCPGMKDFFTAPLPGFRVEDTKQARELFDRWCPGLNEELTGFADGLGVRPERIVVYSMTYLRPNCSHLALLPCRTKEGRPFLARSYEFSDEAEDFTLVRTAVDGRYTHIGTSVLTFGRDEGLNSEGLAVTMSSCGFPVGAQPGMRHPALAGLQYWAVIRALLENCRDVEEGLLFLKDMPIAYNVNMILLDRSGAAALVETLDGRTAVRTVPDGDEHRGADTLGRKEGSCLQDSLLRQKNPCLQDSLLRQENPRLQDSLCRQDKRSAASPATTYLHATNHPWLPELVPFEPLAMKHSLRRYQFIRDTVEQAGTLDREALRRMLLSPYPDGLCCHYYEDFFGTTKSLILDPLDGSLELCWGGLEENGWNRYPVSDPLPASTTGIALRLERISPEEFAMVPIP